MEEFDKDIFVRTTIDTHTNERLEQSMKETDKNFKKMKSFVSSENKFVRFLAWMFIIIVLFFMFPMAITGTITKGMHFEEQKTIWTTFFIIIILGLIKSTLF